ncbi:MAG: hypothetical protein JWO44_937 [Bacteroidetes bacterium]|nr:hypothetical protein [Bacteroidota bacterium]
MDLRKFNSVNLMKNLLRLMRSRVVARDDRPFGDLSTNYQLGTKTTSPGILPASAEYPL